MLKAHSWEALFTLQSFFYHRFHTIVSNSRRLLKLNNFSTQKTSWPQAQTLTHRLENFHFRNICPGGPIFVETAAQVQTLTALWHTINVLKSSSPNFATWSTEWRVFLSSKTLSYSVGMVLTPATSTWRTSKPVSVESWFPVRSPEDPRTWRPTASWVRQQQSCEAHANTQPEC